MPLTYEETITFEQIVMDEDTHDVKQCESLRCEQLGKGPHEADWLVVLDLCRHTVYWCNTRFVRYSLTKIRSAKHNLYCQHCGIEGQQVLSWHPVRF